MKTRKFNRLDFVIIASVILAAVIVFAKLFIGDILSENTHKTFYVTLRVESVENSDLGAFGINERAYYQNGLVPLGKIIADPKISGISDNVPADNGESPADTGRSEVALILEVKGFRNDTGFLLAGVYPLGKGKIIDLKTGGFEGTALIIGITDKKPN